MDDTTVDEWMSFFRDAGIPPNVSATYASKFCQNRIHLNMVLELNRDLLKELGVTLIGDAIAILRHAKSFHEQNVRQKILNSMSSQSQKPPESSKKLISTTGVASVTTNSRRVDGGVSCRVAPTMENSRLGTTVTNGNGNRQEALRIRQQSQLTPKRCSLQRYGISTGRSVTASSSQTDNTSPTNISIGTLQREELHLCETPIDTLGEAATTEDMNVPCSASRSLNNYQTSHSECFLVRGPVESSSTLPFRQSAVPSCVSGSNYIGRRNQGLKRSTQQSPYTSIVSTAQQPAGRVLNGMPYTQTATQSPILITESNILQSAPDEILPTPIIKRKRTVSRSEAHEHEQFDPSVHLQSVGTIEAIHSNGSQVQQFSQLDVGLPRQDVKNEGIAIKDPTENNSAFEPQCQLPLQRREEGSPVQLCTHVQSQERMQMSQSLIDIQPKSQILSESQLPSSVAPSSQLSFQRMPQSHLQYRPTLNLHHESQSSSLPQSSYTVSSQADTQKNQQFQNQKVMMHCNPARSSSTAKLILAGGKKIKKKFKLLHSRPRTQCTTSVPQLLQWSECPSGNEIQRPASTFTISGSSNKSVMKGNENREKEELAHTTLQSGNATRVLWNESRHEFPDAGGDFLEEEQSSLTVLNTARSAGKWDTHWWSKPVANTSDGSLYDDSSSHTFSSSDRFIVSSGEHAENNLQPERVPGQVFSRLGVKVEFVSLDNNVCTTGIKNDTLPISRFGSNIKCKINNSKKLKNLPNQTPQAAASIEDRQPKLRGILKPQTINSEQQEDMEPQDDAQSQKMTANTLLESVARSSTTDLGMVSDAVEENSLSNDSTKLEEDDQNATNFSSDDEVKEQLGTASTNTVFKTVRFGPVCVKEFQNVPPSSGKTAANFRPPVFSRLSAWRKGI